MRKAFTAAVLAAGLATAAAPGVRAEVINMATITCKELLDGKEEDIGTILMWLHGFYAGRANTTTLDTDALTTDSEKIGQYCAQNPTVTVMQAIERLFR
ncbi:HdeA/HdeB family chaperone [Vineibacter terrae]|nr:HdeA/HdeB family chaperone [Vineibacter terrae]